MSYSAVFALTAIKKAKSFVGVARFCGKKGMSRLTNICANFSEKGISIVDEKPELYFYGTKDDYKENFLHNISNKDFNADFYSYFDKMNKSFEYYLIPVSKMNLGNQNSVLLNYFVENLDDLVSELFSNTLPKKLNSSNLINKFASLPREFIDGAKKSKIFYKQSFDIRFETPDWFPPIYSLKVNNIE